MLRALVLCVSAYFAITHSAIYFVSAKKMWTNHTSSLWQDEAASVPPALEAYDKGYLGVKCGVSRNLLCYGTTQTYLDALLLKLSPRDWLTENKNAEMPGRVWHWVTPYPNAAWLLRASRVSYSFFVLIALGFAAFYFFRKAKPQTHLFWPLAFSLTLIGVTIHDSSFVVAMGSIKNDFPAALGLFLFQCVVIYWQNKTPSDRVKLAPCIAMFALMVALLKLSNLPIVFGELFILLGMEFFTREISPRALLGALLKSSLAVLIAYLLMHPATFISSEEAKWIALVRGNFSGYHISAESWGKETALFLSKLPIAIAAVIAMGFAFKPSESRATRKISVALFIGALVPVYFNFQTTLSRPTYYLPYLVTLMAALLYLIPKLNGYLGMGLTTFVALMMGEPALFIDPSRLLNDVKRFAYITPLRDDLSKLNSSGQHPIYLDIQVRLPIPESFKNSHSIRFFDSLSMAPVRVLETIERNGDDHAWITLPCWNEKQRLTQAARAWSLIAKDKCKELQDLNNIVLTQYATGQNLKYFEYFPVSGLPLGNPIAAEVPKDGKIYIQELEGQWDGSDYFEGVTHSFYFERDFTLKGTFAVSPTARKLKLGVTTTCKGDAKLEWVKPIALSKTVSAREHYCSYYSQKLKIDVCNSKWMGLFGPESYFSRWSKHPFVIEPVMVDLPSRSHSPSPIQIEIKGTLPDPQIEKCRVILEPLEIF